MGGGREPGEWRELEAKWERVSRRSASAPESKFSDDYPSLLLDRQHVCVVHRGLVHHGTLGQRKSLEATGLDGVC